MEQIGLLYDGQIYDSYSFISDLLRSAKNEIILIDNYIDNNISILDVRVGDKIYNINIENNVINIILRQIKL